MHLFVECNTLQRIRRAATHTVEVGMPAARPTRRSFCSTNTRRKLQVAIQHRMSAKDRTHSLPQPMEIDCPDNASPGASELA